MTVVYKRHPYFDELSEAKIIGSLEVFNKVINSKLGLDKVHQFFKDVILQILESRSALTIIDPCAVSNQEDRSSMEEEYSFFL